MKRLKNKLLSMETDTKTYSQMYDGAMLVFDPERPLDPPQSQFDPVYYNESIGFKITATHKLAQDKPTVTIIIPTELLGINDYNKASADFCLRALSPYLDELNDELYNKSRPDEENGKYYYCKLNGEVIVRNSAYFAVCPQKDYVNIGGSSVSLLPRGSAPQPKMCICITIQVQLPKRKLKKAIQMLCHDLPNAIDRFVADFDKAGLLSAISLQKIQNNIREYLRTSEYCAFIANGSILPREKGSDLPMKNAIPFVSTKEDTLELFGVKGMGIKRGVTIITGGGYSGKSTLLDAIASGIYDHILGDGRELCITDETGVTICAEDGRCVKNLNISPFIKWLPNASPVDFSTAHASGSTSQASNIMEAIDNGARVLFIDEDRSATNFMIRDKTMRKLIEKEPITPFTDRVRELYYDMGISTILVIGGSGEYLRVADKVYMMDEFMLYDVTERSKALMALYQSEAICVSPASYKQSKILLSKGFSSYPRGATSERLVVSDMGFIIVGDERIDIRGLYDIVTERQLVALGFIIRHLEITNRDEIIDIKKKVDKLYSKIEEEGLDTIYSSYFTTCERFFDLPRRQEIYALINRMRLVNYK